MRQIKIHAKANSIDLKDMLVHKIPVLLIEEAGNWFELYNGYIEEWEEFEEAFMQEYCAPDYKQKLMWYLEKRF